MVDRSEGDEDAGPPAPLSRGARAGLVAVVLVAVAWFVVSWHVLGSPLVDAVGEAAGGVLALLVVVSVVGAVRRAGD